MLLSYGVIMNKTLIESLSESIFQSHSEKNPTLIPVAGTVIDQEVIK